MYHSLKEGCRGRRVEENEGEGRRTFDDNDQKIHRKVSKKTYMFGFYLYLRIRG